MFAPDNSRACENSWELLSSFLAGHFFYTVRTNAMADQIMRGRQSALVDHFQASLSAAGALLAKPGDTLSAMWAQFHEYARKSVPALKHETESMFALRMAQAYAPAEHVRSMRPQQVRDYAMRAFMTVTARAHTKAIEYTGEILSEDKTVIPAMQDAFNELSRSHRFELGRSLHSRGSVQAATPYDDAARHISELTAEVGRLASENARLAQKFREMEMQGRMAPREDTRGSRSAAAALAQAREHLRARERLARENRELRSRLSSAQSVITSLQSDARTLLDAARSNIDRYAKSMAPDDVLPSDSVSVAAKQRRAARPSPPSPPSPPPAPTGDGTTVADMMSAFDTEAFSQDFS
jgi:hypothetical protein